jgi:hypothetical protein
MLALALILATQLPPCQLCAQLLKRKPLPDTITTAEEVEHFLSLLEVDELLGYERVESVCIQFLKRDNVPEFARLEAINRLAQLHRSDPVAELLPRIEQLDASDELGDSELSTLSDLSALLPQQPPSALKKFRARVQKLATEGKHDAARRSAMAALVAADRSYDAVWSLASASTQSLVDVLQAVPQLPSDLPRESLFRHVQPLVQESNPPEIQSAAIEAAALLDDNGRETFETLSDFIQRGVHPDACVRAICNIPSDQWTGSQRMPLANSLISRLAETPIQQRTSREARDWIKLIKTLARLMPSQHEAEIRSRLEKYTVEEYRIAAPKGDPHFAPSVLVVPTGKAIQLVFCHEEIKPHNLVVVHGLAAQEMIRQSATGGPQDNNTGKKQFPSAEQIVGATEAIRTGETAAVAFDTPDQPTVYLLACTRPDHEPRRYGAIVITEDVQTYRTEHQPLPTADELLGIRPLPQLPREQ